MFTKKRLTICAIAESIYILGCFVAFLQSKDWARAGIVIVLGIVFLQLLHKLYVSGINAEKWNIFSKGIRVFLCIGLVLTLICFMKRGIFRERIYDFSIESQIITYSKDISKTSKDVTVYKNDLSETVFFSLLSEKTVFVEQSIGNDYRVQLLTGAIRHNLIDMNLMDSYKLKHISQFADLETITIRYGNEEKKELYLLLGGKWEESEKILVAMDDNGEVWAIPEALIDSNYKVFETSKVQADSSAIAQYEEDIKIIWDFTDSSPLFFGKKVGGQRIYVAFCGMAYLIFLTALGYMLFFGCSNERNHLHLFLALPLGMVIEVLACILMGIVHLPINLTGLVFVCILLDILLVLAFKKCFQNKHLNNMGERSDDSHRCILISLFALLGIYFACCYFPGWYGGFGDPSRNTALGRLMVYRHEWASLFSSISSYSLLMPFLTAGSVLFHVDTLYYLSPCLSIVSILAIGGILVQKSGKEIERKYKIWLCILICFVIFVPNLSVLVIFAIGGVLIQKSRRGTEREYKVWLCISICIVIFAPMFILNSIVIMNNLPIGLLVGISVALMLLRKDYTTYLGGLLFVFSSIVRIENPLLFSLFFMVLDLIIEYNVSRKLSFAVLLASFGVFILNYIFFNPASKDFWTPSRGAAVLIVVLLTSTYIYLRPTLSAKFNFLYEYRSAFINVMLILLPVGYSIFGDHEKVLWNIYAYWQNTIASGYYGSAWIILGMLAIFTFSFIKQDNRSFVLIELLFITYMFGFDIMLFRAQPIYCKYGDSSARMLLHILPCVIIYIMCLLEDTKRCLNFPHAKEPSAFV